MGLIKCIDCGKLFSDRIDSCPDCGCPKKFSTKDDTVIEKKNNNIEKKNKSEYLTNKELMSYEELKEFAFQSVFGMIEKEIDVNHINVKKSNDSVNEVDYYLTAENINIGLDVVIDIAPSKTWYVYNEKHAKEMSNINYKYAVARIGVGSSDHIRFDRSVVLNNDNYYFDYKELLYYDYEELNNTEVIYSLSQKSNVNNILLRDDKSVSPYAIQKPKYDYVNDYYNDKFNDNINKLFEKYDLFGIGNIPIANMIDVLGILTNHFTSSKDLLIVYLNAIDYCKGHSFKDSKPVEENKIIQEVKSLVSSNNLIKFEEYDAWNIAVYVYYFFKNKDKYIQHSAGDIETYKKTLYEERPDLFGFPELLKRNIKYAEKNSPEYILGMQKNIIDFAKIVYPKYIEINVKINSAGIKEKIDFININKIIDDMLLDSKEKLKFLTNNFDITKEFAKKNIYGQYRRLLNSFIFLLEDDLKINHKLNSKANGGKYGLFEYKKESKIRNAKVQEFLKEFDILANSFEVKELSDNTYKLIDACEHLIYILKDKYITNLTEKDKLAELRIEICKFHDYFISLPFDRDAEDFKNGILFTIEDFIQLIEDRENNIEEEKIIEKENELFDNFEIIYKKIYEIQI